MSYRYILAREFARSRGCSEYALVCNLSTLAKKIKDQSKAFTHSLFYRAFEARKVPHKRYAQYYVNATLIESRLKARAELIDIIYELDERESPKRKQKRKMETWRSELARDYIKYANNFKERIPYKDYQRYYVRYRAATQNFSFYNLHFLMFFDKWLLEKKQIKWLGSRAWFSQFVAFNNDIK